MIFFTILGMAVAVLLAAFVLYSIVDLGPIYGDSQAKQGFLFSVFKFGVLYAKPGTRLNENVNRLRKTEGKSWFISVPAWFNRAVYNVGGVKK